MAKFLFSYRMPKNHTPGQPDAMAAWGAWFEELGSAILEPGNPTFESNSVGNTPADTRLGGYTIVEAVDLDAATTMAKGSPALAAGGGVEVGLIAEIM
jgi:hypothetical protein